MSKNKPYFIRKEDNGQYILYRRTSVSEDYIMSFRYEVEAKEVCRQLNLESIRFDGMYHEYCNVRDELNRVSRELYDYQQKYGDS